MERAVAQYPVQRRDPETPQYGQKVLNTTKSPHAKHMQPLAVLASKLTLRIQSNVIA
jgi:hypothetical protein